MTRTRRWAWIGVACLGISWAFFLRGFPHFHPVAGLVVNSFGVEVLPLSWLCLSDPGSYKSRCMRWGMLTRAIAFAVLVLPIAVFGSGLEASMAFWYLGFMLQFPWLIGYSVIAVAQESALR